MKFDPKAKLFYIKTNWGERKEDQNSIAERLRRFLDMIGDIDETLRPWVLGGNSAIPYRSVGCDLVEIIRRDIKYGEDGKIELDAGYSVLGWSEDQRQRYSLRGSVGGVYRYPIWNAMTFETHAGVAVNETIATYVLMKQVTLAVIACWEPALCFTRSSALDPDTANEGAFAKAWMTYVTPINAASVDLVGIPFSERTPDGGQLLSATNQTFDADNPAHIEEGARRISLATQHLNALIPDR